MKCGSAFPDVSESRTTFYSFGGIGFVVRGSPEIATALDDRLRLLACHAIDSCDLRFDINVVAGPEDHWIAPMSSAARPFYETPRGEALYFEAEDRLYMDCENRIRFMCSPKEGTAVISVAEPRKKNLWLASHPFFTIPWLELLRRRGLYNLHAAGFRVNGQAVLFPGTSGSGKSTLSVALLRAGFEFLGDDMLFLARESAGLRVLGFPDELDVTHQTVEFFPELKYLMRSPLKPGWPKRAIRAESVFGRMPIAECPPAVLIFPRIASVECSELRPMTKHEAFLELAPNVMLTEIDACKAHFEILSQLVKTTTCYRLETGRDFDAIPGLIETTVTAKTWD